MNSDGTRVNILAGVGLMVFISVHTPLVLSFLGCSTLTPNICHLETGMQLGDFGVSRLMVDTSSTFTGTPVFMAPEILEGHPYNKTSDIWSLGSVMYTLCMLKVPFMANHVSRLRVSSLCTAVALIQ